MSTLENGRFGMIGDSPIMLNLYNTISKVAPTDSTVLIRGERGTGKELVAKAIADNSGRKDKKYMIINCAAIPSELIESELFGHEKGSFTSAYSSRKGKFEYANNGTILLDEIVDLTYHLQPKLLRVLEYHTLERVGGNETITVDVRLIAATSRDLEKLIEEGTFRHDLYDRLNVITLFVPSLRERKNDIPLLINYFLNGKIKVDDDVVKCLKEYSWPGNVRELKAVIERLSVLHLGDRITMDDLMKYTNIKNDGKVGDSNQPSYIGTHGIEELKQLLEKSNQLITDGLEIGFERLEKSLSHLTKSIKSLDKKISINVEEARELETQYKESELYRSRRKEYIEEFKDASGKTIYTKVVLESIMNSHIFKIRPGWNIVEMLEYAFTGFQTLKKREFIESVIKRGDPGIYQHIEKHTEEKSDGIINQKTAKWVKEKLEGWLKENYITINTLKELSIDEKNIGELAAINGMTETLSRNIVSFYPHKLIPDLEKMGCSNAANSLRDRYKLTGSSAK